MQSLPNTILRGPPQTRRAPQDDGAARATPHTKNPFIYMTTYPRSPNRAYAARVLLARGASWGVLRRSSSCHGAARKACRPMQLAAVEAIPQRLMRRLRVVPRKHTSGRLGSPSAATTSGCHAMAGRGCDEGGEIRWIGERVARIASRKRGPFAQNRRRWRAARRRGSFSPSHGGGGARHQSTLRLAARRFPHQAREKRPTPTCAAARDRLLVAVW